MSKRFWLLIRVVFIVFIISSGVCVFAQGKDPNAAEVLRCYKESLSWVQSVSMKIDMVVDVSENHPNKSFCPYETHLIFRRDHDRTEWIGQRLLFDEQGNVDPLNSRVIKQIMTGELYVDLQANLLSTPLKTPPPRAMISRDYKMVQEIFLDSPGNGGPIFGKMFGSSRKGVVELLAGAAELRLRDVREDIGGTSCYVLEATTKHGRVTAWIAPEKGYNALKWVIHKTSGDLYDERPISSNSWTAVFDSVELQKVGDVFVPKGGVFTNTIEHTDGSTIFDRIEYKTSDIRLNPDFDALGAFKIDLPDGTWVYMREDPGVRYVWQNGKIVPYKEPDSDED